MEQGYKYEKGINFAIAEAVKVAKSFLTNIKLSSHTCCQYLECFELAFQEFAENPYAYEFGMMLTRYGAFGEKSSNNSDKSITKIGENILVLLGRRTALKNNDFINKSIVTASPMIGNSYSSTKLDANNNKVTFETRVLMEIFWAQEPLI